MRPGVHGPRCCRWALALAVLGTASTARADSNLTLAETLFDDAKELIAHGNSAAACPKLAESHRLDPKLGTLLNLAACHESVGKTASAWGEFSEARRMAVKQGRADREAYAADHVGLLEQRLSRVTFSSEEPGVEPDLTLDDELVGAALFHTPVPLDPGPHAVIARRAGRVAVTVTFTVSPGPSAQTVSLPKLATAPLDLGPELGPPPPVSGQWKRSAGLVALGIGAVGAGLSTAFGLNASSKHSDAGSHCSGRVCDPEGLELQGSARSSADAATVAAGVAVVAIGVGAFLLLTAPPRPETRRQAERSPMRGEF